MKKPRGFTLMELLVAIAIIALLMSILMPAIKKVRIQAKRLICANHLRSIGQGLFIYADQNKNLLPLDYDPATPNQQPSQRQCTWWVYDGRYSNPPIPLRLGLLHKAGIIPEGKVFYCPSNVRPSQGFEDYTNPKPWGVLPQQWNIDHNAAEVVRINYTYYPISKTEKQNIGGEFFAAMARRTLELDTCRTMVTDEIVNLSGIGSHPVGTKAGGMNAVMGDGHIKFFTFDANEVGELWPWELLPDRPEFHIALERLMTK